MPFLMGKVMTNQAKLATLLLFSTPVVFFKGFEIAGILQKAFWSACMKIDIIQTAVDAPKRGWVFFLKKMKLLRGHLTFQLHLANKCFMHVSYKNTLWYENTQKKQEIIGFFLEQSTLTLLYNGYLSVWSSMLSTEICSKIQRHSARKGLLFHLLYVKSNVTTPFLLLSLNLIMEISI